MADLQCPATVVFVSDAAAVDSLPGGLFRVAGIREFSVPAGSAEELDSFVSDLSDEFRGETVVVVAPADAVSTVLQARGVPIPAAGPRPTAAPRPPAGGERTAPYTGVSVDSGGWTLLP